jgi:hypothetical protein
VRAHVADARLARQDDRRDVGVSGLVCVHRYQSGMLMKTFAPLRG